MLAGTDGVAYAAELRSQPFGSRRAPSNCDRMAEFLNWAISKFFGINVAVYSDDIRGAEPLHTCCSASDTIKAARNIFGLALDVGKECPHTRSISLLVAHVDIRTGFVEAPRPNYRAAAQIDDMEQIITRGRRTPPQAAKIPGRVGFAQSLLFGNVGRPLLGALSDRRYDRMSGTRYPSKMTFATRYFGGSGAPETHYRAGYGSRRSIRCSSTPTIAGNATLGLRSSSRDEYMANTQLPEWFATERTRIGEYEMAGILYWLKIAMALFPGDHILA